MLFHKLNSDIDVKALYEEIDMSLWQACRGPGHGEIFSDSQQQILFGWTEHKNEYVDVIPKDLQNMLLPNFRPVKLYFKYPNVHKFLSWFIETYGGKIARVTYYILPAKKRVGTHVDAKTDGKETDYIKKNLYEYKDRFHLVLTGKYIYYVGGRVEKFLKGNLWWFDNKKMHGSYNYSNTDRIILIFDVKDSHWRDMI